MSILKPTTQEIKQLGQFQNTLHGPKIPQLQNEAQKLKTYLKFVVYKVTKSYQPPKHIGRVIVDGVLQVGKNFSTQVLPAVLHIEKIPQAATLSGFINLLITKGVQYVTGNFKTQGTHNDLLSVAKFFQSQKNAQGKNLNTFDDVKEWLAPYANRNKLLTKNSGLSGKVFRISDKTADYFRVLTGHWDAVAVDRGIKQILNKAGILRSANSTVYTYEEMRTIVQLAALPNDRPIDLDQWIYKFYERNKKATNKVKTAAKGTGGNQQIKITSSTLQPVNFGNPHLNLLISRLISEIQKSAKTNIFYDYFHAGHGLKLSKKYDPATNTFSRNFGYINTRQQRDIKFPNCPLPHLTYACDGGWGKKLGLKPQYIAPQGNRAKPEYYWCIDANNQHLIDVANIIWQIWKTR
jgi:hypothetical protein